MVYEIEIVKGKNEIEGAIDINGKVIKKQSEENEKY